MMDLCFPFEVTACPLPPSYPVILTVDISKCDCLASPPVHLNHIYCYQYHIAFGLCPLVTFVKNSLLLPSRRLPQVLHSHPEHRVAIMGHINEPIPVVGKSPGDCFKCLASQFLVFPKSFSLSCAFRGPCSQLSPQRNL